MFTQNYINKYRQTNVEIYISFFVKFSILQNSMFQISYTVKCFQEKAFLHPLPLSTAFLLPVQLLVHCNFFNYLFSTQTYLCLFKFFSSRLLQVLSFLFDPRDLCLHFLIISIRFLAIHYSLYFLFLFFSQSS